MSEKSQRPNNQTGPGSRGPAIGAGEKPQNFKQSLNRLMSEILVYKLSFFLVIVTAIISTIFAIVGPKEMGKATTELFEGIMRKIQGTGGINFTAVGQILLFVLALYVISSIFAMIQGYIMTEITQKISYSLRKRMMEKLNHLPMAYFENKPYGDILSRITNDIDTMGNGLNQSITTLITSIITMVGILVMMVSISWLMTLIVVLVVPLSMIFLKGIMGVSQKYFKHQQASLGVINGQMEEIFAGQMIVRAFNQEGTVIDNFTEENKKLNDSAWKSQFISGLMFPIMEFISNLGYVGVVVSGAYFALLGQVTVGDIQAFTQYVARFTQPMTQMAQAFTMLQSMVAAAERIFNLLDVEEEAQTETRILNLEQVHGRIHFDHIVFEYRAGEPVISNFSAQIDAGKKVALVGPTGAGKSTIVKLLMRFYDVAQGAITLDGTNIQAYQRESYRQSISMVLQDTWLFKGTILDNIKYGDPTADDADVYEAAKKAKVHHFIESLPGGYYFMINEEASNISLGQKQLLTIARAILADRPILILDEATSSVDTRTEILIQEAMDHLMVGRTSFVIAHRLSTIRDADLILYMENGDIVEQGNHEELLALNGRYADLYNSQFTDIG